MWGTTVVNGVEVLNARRHYYGNTDSTETPPDTLENNERLFKFLGVWKDVQDYDGKGIKSSWFTLNKSNGPEGLNVDSSYVPDNLNRMWWDDNDGLRPEGLTLTTSIVISENFGSISTLTGIDWAGTKEEIASYIRLNYESIWNSKKIEQVGVGVINKGPVLDTVSNTYIPDEDDLSPDDPWLSIISRYVLRDSGIPCTIKDVEVGLGNALGTVYNTAVVTIEIPYYHFSPSTAMVNRIYNDIDTTLFPTSFAFKDNKFSSLRFNGFTSTNEHVTQSTAKQVTYYETVEDLDPDTISRSYLQWETSTVGISIYDNFWLQDGDIWYFKADVINNPKSYGTTHAKLNAYMFSLLDTGYKKKKVPWYKKLIAIVVFIVAVILAVPSGGASLTLAYASVVAFAVIIGSLVVALVTMALGALGMVEWASAFAWASKAIEPLVTVASIIMIVNGISQVAIQLQKQTVTEILSNMATDVVKDFATGIGDVFAGNVTSKAAINVITKSLDAYNSTQVKKLESINSKNIDLKAEYDKLAEESQRESDIIMGYMRIYGKPATADQSIYAATFDLPYERSGGTMTIGNVQITTKQAIRKADYDEPMFGDMIFV